MNKDSIFVAKLSDLSSARGKYFIDYQMRPALAFRDERGLPVLISAKCTHLGCTVGQDLDGQGRILCPCHISYFDIKTGQPTPGSPAKSPLPHLGWALKDEQGNLLVAQDPEGRREGAVDPSQAEKSLLFIVKRFS
ncbi:MAG: Rieske (2Fe-2S) protein [Candidatus Omnitrophica bacterium]|nr:Rieske (2Fe-2S) protein [Candidatus Omnitrophota bacterium]